MKKLTEEELVPGGKNYAKLHPHKPENVLFTNSHHILVFSDGIVIFRKNEEPPSDDFGEWRNAALIPFDEIKNAAEQPGGQPEIHFVEDAEDGNIDFFLVINSCSCKLRWNAARKTFRPIWKTLFNGQLHCRDGRGNVAFSSGKSLYVVDRNGALEKIYTEENPDIRIDKTPSRDEFGIEKLLFWSPDGQQLAFYRTDDSRVAEYPLVKIQDPIASVEMIKYPMAGKPSEEVSVGIIHVKTKKCVFIGTKQDDALHIAPPMNHKESYLTSLTWLPDSSHILLCEVDRRQQYCQTKIYDAQSGQLRQFLFDEQSETYVEPEDPYFCAGAEQIFFLSRRSGFKHLYRLNVQANEIRPITQGDWELVQVLHFSAAEHTFYALAAYPSPTNRTVLCINVDTGEWHTLNDFRGVQILYHSAQTADYAVWEERADLPGQFYFKGGRLYKENDHFIENGYDRPAIKCGFIEKNGENLYYRITFPKQQRAERCPVLLYVYGGPHVQLIQDTYIRSTKGIEEVMAEEGFITLCIDPRGSAYRGKSFEAAIYQHINQPQVEDYDFALDWFFQNYANVADPTRVAVYGWSFGGCMTITMLLNSRHKFAIGVAGGAVVDWRYYEVMYTERYMGELSDETDDFYRQCDLRQQISRLNTPLYLIHCDNDPVVLWQHTLSLLQKVNRETEVGTFVNYYVYPGHPHNVSGAERVQLTRKIRSIFAFLNR